MYDARVSSQPPHSWPEEYKTRRKEKKDKLGKVGRRRECASFTADSSIHELLNCLPESITERASPAPRPTSQGTHAAPQRHTANAQHCVNRRHSASRSRTGTRTHTHILNTWCARSYNYQSTLTIRATHKWWWCSTSSAVLVITGTAECIHLLAKENECNLSRHVQSLYTPTRALQQIVKW